MDIYVGTEFSVVMCSFSDEYEMLELGDCIETSFSVSSLFQYQSDMYYTPQQLLFFPLNEEEGEDNDEIRELHSEVAVEKCTQLFKDSPILYTFDNTSRNMSLWNIDRNSVQQLKFPGLFSPSSKNKYSYDRNFYPSSSMTALRPLSESAIATGYENGDILCYDLMKEKSTSQLLVPVEKKKNLGLVEEEDFVYTTSLSTLCYDMDRNILSSIATDENTVLLWSLTQSTSSSSPGSLSPIRRIEFDYALEVSSLFQIPSTPNLIIGDEEGRLYMLDIRKLSRSPSDPTSTYVWRSKRTPSTSPEEEDGETKDSGGKQPANCFFYDPKKNFIATTSPSELSVWNLSKYGTEKNLESEVTIFESYLSSVVISDPEYSRSPLLSSSDQSSVGVPEEVSKGIEIEISHGEAEDELKYLRSQLLQLSSDVDTTTQDLNLEQIKNQSLKHKRETLKSNISKKRHEIIELNSFLSSKIKRDKLAKHTNISDIFERHEIEIQRKIEQIQQNIVDSKSEEFKARILEKKKQMSQTSRQLKKLETLESELKKQEQGQQNKAPTSQSGFSFQSRGMNLQDLVGIGLRGANPFMKLQSGGGGAYNKLVNLEKKLKMEMEQLKKVNNVLLNPKLVNFIYGNSEKDTFVRGYLGFRIVERLVNDSKSRKEIQFLEEVFFNRFSDGEDNRFFRDGPPSEGEDTKKASLKQRVTKMGDGIEVWDDDLCNDDDDGVEDGLESESLGIERKYFPQYFGWWKEKKKICFVGDGDENSSKVAEKKGSPVKKENKNFLEVEQGKGRRRRKSSKMRKKNKKGKGKKGQDEEDGKNSPSAGKSRTTIQMRRMTTTVGPGVTPRKSVEGGLGKGTGPVLPPSAEPFVFKIIIEKNVDTLENFVAMNSSTMTTEQRVKLIVECGKIIQYFHENELVYGSIHPSNFLIYNNDMERISMKKKGVQSSSSAAQKKLTLKLWDFRNVVKVPFTVRKQYGFANFQDPTISQLIGLEDHTPYCRDVYAFVCLIYFIFFPTLTTPSFVSKDNNVSNLRQKKFNKVCMPFDHLMNNIICPYFDPMFNILELPYLLYNICVGMNVDYDTGIQFLSHLEEFERDLNKRQSLYKHHEEEESTVKSIEELIFLKDEKNISEIRELLKETKQKRSYFPLLKAGRQHTKLEVSKIPVFLIKLMESGMNFVSRKRPDIHTIIEQCMEYLKDANYEGESDTGDKSPRKKKKKKDVSFDASLNWDRTHDQRSSRDHLEMIQGQDSLKEVEKEEEEDEDETLFDEELETELIDRDFMLQEVEYWRRAEEERYWNMVSFLNPNSEESESAKQIDETPINEWNAKNIQTWLRFQFFQPRKGLKFSINKSFFLYHSCFRNINDGHRFLTLTDEDMNVLGLKNQEHREQVLRRVNILKKRGKFVSREKLVYEKLRRVFVLNKYNSFVQLNKIRENEGGAREGPEAGSAWGVLEGWNLREMATMLCDVYELKKQYFKFSNVDIEKKRLEMEKWIVERFWRNPGTTAEIEIGIRKKMLHEAFTEQMKYKERIEKTISFDTNADLLRLPIHLVLTERGRIIWDGREGPRPPIGEMMNPYCSSMYYMKDEELKYFSQPSDGSPIERFVHVGLIIGPWYLEYSPIFELCIPKILSPEIVSFFLTDEHADQEPKPFLTFQTQHMNLETIIDRLSNVVSSWNTSTQIPAAPEPYDPQIKFVSDILQKLKIFTSFEEFKRKTFLETSVERKEPTKSLIDSYFLLSSSTTGLIKQKKNLFKTSLTTSLPVSNSFKSSFEVEERSGMIRFEKHDDLDKFTWKKVYRTSTGFDKILEEFPEEYWLLKQFDRIFWLDEMELRYRTGKNERRVWKSDETLEDEDGECPFENPREFKSLIVHT